MVNRNLRKLGLIGGTSWHSTIVYYRGINEAVGKEIGTQGNPNLILYSQNIELMRSGEIDKINQTYLETAKNLQKIGAEAIMLCANTPHIVYPFVAPNIDIPILHIADAVGADAKKRSISKLGLLGNRPTMTKGFLQSHLKTYHNIETFIPEDQYLDQSHHFVSKQLTQGKFTEEAKAFFTQQIQLFKKRGIEGVILGCTELPMLISQEDTDLPLFATTQLHIDMAVRFILGRGVRV